MVSFCCAFYKKSNGNKITRLINSQFLKSKSNMLLFAKMMSSSKTKIQYFAKVAEVVKIMDNKLDQLLISFPNILLGFGKLGLKCAEFL
jgi:hypothetical protein